MRRKNKITLIVVLVLAILAGNLSYPDYFNKGVDFLNNKFKTGLPYFWEVPFRLGLDLRGGVHLEYEADLNNVKENERAGAMEALRDVIERRINIYGVSEPLIQIQGQNRLVVELPGVKDVSQAIEWIGQTPWLEFREEMTREEKMQYIDVMSQEDIDQLLKIINEKAGKEIKKEEILDYIYLPLFKPTELNGSYLEKAQIVFDQTTNRPEIQLIFNKEGIDLFAKITERNIQKPLAIFLDGMSIVDTDGDGKITGNDLYAPVVQDKISAGKAVISGQMTLDKAKEITQRLNSGALPVNIGSPVSQRVIGPTLGEKSLQQSLKAGIIGFLAVISFMIILFRIPGFLASIALIIYITLTVALFKLIPVTLTLPGIAGFILSVGMAVDANILIFSRMREELKQSRGYLYAIEEGFKRAWPAIRDGNLVTILVGFILFAFGSGFVQGFALTLIIGNVISVLSAVFVTQNFLRLFSGDKSKRWLWLWK